MQYLEMLNKGNQILRAKNIKSSNLDCELILSKVLNKTREEILINLNNKIDESQEKKFLFFSISEILYIILYLKSFYFFKFANFNS